MVWKESRKAFKVYADLVKDIIFLLIILHAHGVDISIDGLTELANSPWTFATTVSKQFQYSILKNTAFLARSSAAELY